MLEEESRIGDVPRPRLLGQLESPSPLVLLSGPAGAGKSVLLRQWCSLRPDANRCVVNVDHEATLFWQPVLRALASHGLPVEALSGSLGDDLLLGSRSLADLTQVLRSSERRWTVVMDGFELSSRPLADEVETMVQQSGNRLRLVLAARVDPVLPLYRRRLEGTLAEVRAADLAFTDREASQMLAGVGAPLAPEPVHALNQRMGGWAAGLRFTAAARRGRRGFDDVNVVLPDVLADVSEYLLDEVLDGLDPQTRDLLLRMSVPDVLEPELAEQLAGPDAAHQLAALQRSNLFLEPAGEDGGLRYQPFFRDLLRAQMAHEDPELAARLHRVVAVWLRHQEEWERASLQLATGGLWEDLAEQLVEDLMVARLMVGADTRLRRAARRIPADLATPAAQVVRAALALASGDAARCGDELQAARRPDWVDAHGSVDARAEGYVGAATGALAYALVAAAHAASARPLDDAETALQHATRTLAEARRPAPRLVSPEIEGLLHVASACVALRQGQLDRALTALARVQTHRRLPAQLRSATLGHQAVAHTLAGRLSQGHALALESVAVADDAHLAGDLRNPAAYTALALVALERDDLSAAARHLGRARACRSFVTDPVARTVAAGTLAQLEARPERSRPPTPGATPADLWTGVRDPWLVDWLRLRAAEAAVVEGRAGEAQAILRALDEAGRPAAQVVAATVYAEQGRTVALGRTLAQSRADDDSPVSRVGQLLAQAVYEADRRSPQAAALRLQEALAVASTERVRRPFRRAPHSVRRVLNANQDLLDLHPWLHDHVAAPSGGGGHAAGSHGLLTGSGQELRGRSRQQRRRSPGAPALTEQVATARPTGLAGTASMVGMVGMVGIAVRGTAGAVLTEPLTPKELEVLEHLAALLTTQEVADRMFVSVNTVRTHIRGILRKLSVNRRNAAIRRARELGLLHAPATAPTVTLPG